MVVLAELRTQTQAELVLLAAFNGSGTSFGHGDDRSHRYRARAAQESGRCEVCTVNEAMAEATLATMRLLSADRSSPTRRRDQLDGDGPRRDHGDGGRSLRRRRACRKLGIALTLIGVAVAAGGLATYVLAGQARLRARDRRRPAARAGSVGGVVVLSLLRNPGRCYGPGHASVPRCSSCSSPHAATIRRPRCSRSPRAARAGDVLRPAVPERSAAPRRRHASISSAFPTNSLIVDRSAPPRETLDGFGLNAAIFARFDGAIDPTQRPRPAASVDRRRGGLPRQRRSRLARSRPALADHRAFRASRHADARRQPPRRAPLPRLPARRGDDLRARDHVARPQRRRWRSVASSEMSRGARHRRQRVDRARARGLPAAARSPRRARRRRARRRRVGGGVHHAARRPTSRRRLRKAVFAARLHRSRTT